MKTLALRLLTTAALMVSAASAAQIRVTVTNLSPTNGTFITPVWVGFHNGTFVVYTAGQPASAALERIAEDGNTAPLSTAFNTSGLGTADGTLGMAPIAPGSSVTMDFNLDAFDPNNRYFSYASMVVPSNDAFIGNGDPLAFQIFDGAGNFIPVDRTVTGAMVRDAGTEVNDEIAANTAFLGQTVPNTGTTENGVVTTHGGFIPAGAILSDPMFASANFLASGYNVANIRIEAVPEPATWSLMLAGAAGLLLKRRQRQRA